VAQLVLLVLALTNSGCLAAAAGVAGGAAVGYAYFKGKLCELYSASYEDTWAATRTALGELAMPIVKEERTGSKGYLESRTADGETVRIHVQAEASKIPAEGQITRVCVRVATFGDGPVSDRILDQVGLHLTVAPLPGVTQTGASSPPVISPQQTAPPPLLPPEPVPAQTQMPK
jgi:hypothetical protein